MNLPININIDASVRTEVCREQMAECMPLLDYCIENTEDPITRSNLIQIRQTLPIYVQQGNTDVVSTACSFIRESYETISVQAGLSKPPMQLVLIVARVNKAAFEAAERNKHDPEMQTRIQSILQPLSNRMASIEDLADRAESIIAQLKNV